MAGVLCLLVEYAWVVPLQRKPAARRSSAAERGRGSQNGLAWRGPCFSSGCACSSVKISKVIGHLFLLIMQSMQNLTPLFSSWKLSWKTLWQKDIIVSDKLFQSHRFCSFFSGRLNSDEHQERTESSRQRRKRGKERIQNVGNWARSPKVPR